jgi:hypothetical protein
MIIDTTEITGKIKASFKKATDAIRRRTENPHKSHTIESKGDDIYVYGDFNKIFINGCEINFINEPPKEEVK